MLVRLAPNRALTASVALTLAVLLLGATGCERSCAKLADRLCEQASMSNAKNADEQCESWRARSKRVTPATCQAALRSLQETR